MIKWHYKNSLDEPPERSPVGKAVSFASLPLAFLGAFKAAQIRIRRGLYKNLAVQGAFDDLQKERHEVYKQITKDCLDDKLPHIREEVIKLEEAYHDAVVDRVHKLGYANLSDQFKSLKRNEKLDSILLFAGVSSVTIGALLTIANQIDKYGVKTESDSPALR